VRDAVKEQAQINGCSTETKTVFSKGAVTCKAYKGCPANAAVELCTIGGEGHRWPGSPSAGPAICVEKPSKKICRKFDTVVGPANNDINGAEVVWQFFKQFHLP
jgi:poly(3-hydroxybutyrate) depolymerase